jgi:UDP-2-acetamido-2,6-beta-L-arabino-hexul-4-ose reductase
VTRILVTGAQGFIGRNLCVRLRELKHDVTEIGRHHCDDDLRAAVDEAAFVYHLAGVNRPETEAEFETGNADFTRHLCDLLAATQQCIPLVLSSSTQAESENPYGRSKRAAEQVVVDYGAKSGAPSFIFRLTNVFGKWARPHYNSAVATFCSNIATGQPITVHDADAPLKLIYIDDVVSAFVALLEGDQPPGFCDPGPVYETTVGKVADIIQSFPASRDTLITAPVGAGLTRALYSTYLSYLPPAHFSYTVPVHADPRGAFVEMLKTENSGQFSYFTSGPGITRGEHYHHTKTEKFLVVSGTARFGFRHIVTGETYDLTTKGGDARIVETIPGWTHNITNIGETELLVMLWANEIFDRDRPDTIGMKV